MFHDFEQVDRAVYTALSGLRTGLNGNEEVPVLVGVPEEEVVSQELFPAITMQMIDERLSNNTQGPPFLVLPIYEDGSPEGARPTRFGLFDAPQALTWTYQIDVYSQTRQEMVRLLREIAIRLPQQRGALRDPEGYAVDVARTDYRDLSQTGKEERIIRVSLTYDISGLLLLNTEPRETYGAVEAIKITVEDTDPRTFKETVWVDKKPAYNQPEPEE